MSATPFQGPAKFMYASAGMSSAPSPTLYAASSQMHMSAAQSPTMYGSSSHMIVPSVRAVAMQSIPSVFVQSVSASPVHVVEKAARKPEVMEKVVEKPIFVDREVEVEKVMQTPSRARSFAYARQSVRQRGLGGIPSPFRDVDSRAPCFAPCRL
jgi:hypothetical protein